MTTPDDDRPDEDLSDEVLLALYPPITDRRLMPRAGRRDRFFMMLLGDPADPAVVAEAGWMMDHDPQGFRDAQNRADESYGGPGTFKAHLARLMRGLLDGPSHDAYMRAIVVERLLLGMDSAGYTGPIDLDFVNDYLRRKARSARSGA